MYHWAVPDNSQPCGIWKYQEVIPTPAWYSLLVVFSSSSRVGSSAVNKLVGESRVTAHVRSLRMMTCIHLLW